jgi:hypothetical protein
MLTKIETIHPIVLTLKTNDTDQNNRILEIGSATLFIDHPIHLDQDKQSYLNHLVNKDLI